MKPNRLFSFAVMLALSMSAYAGTLDVRSFRYAGPFTVVEPYQVDRTDVNGREFNPKDLLKAASGTDALKDAPFVSSLPASGTRSVGLIGFSVQNQDYTAAELKVEGLKVYEVTLDGEKVSGTALKLEPATHEFVIRYLAEAWEVPEPVISLETPKDGVLSLREDGRGIFSMYVNERGFTSGSISVSPEGKYLALNTEITDVSYHKSRSTEIFRLSDGQVISRKDGRVEWLPLRDAFSYTVSDGHGRNLVCCDPETNMETVMARNIPEGRFQISPDEKYLIYQIGQEGPEDKGLRQILNPEDRQPGWRDRSYIARYEIASGVMQPLTFGYSNSYLMDISSDGGSILFMVQTLRLTERPTDLFSLYRMDIRTLETECLIDRDGFISRASFSPDGARIAVSGSPEALGGIANRVPAGMTPSMTESELYVMDIADRKVRALTADFDPCVSSFKWSPVDGKIYFTAEDKDCVHLFKADPDGKGIVTVPVNEDVVNSFSLSLKTPLLVYSGCGLEDAGKVFVVDLKKQKQQCIKDFNPLKLDGVELGEGLPYEFTNSRGDVINGFYVLPPGFDSARKYPLLVHYYGGCSPTNRTGVNSAYSPQLYAAQGYVIYILNPSGATGFGQEFSARHVNTAGHGVAEDIIEGVKKFCEDHPFVNSSKIGCFGASYGGFMTDYLFTQTDIFAAGVSHAGISDHTGYWGEGYWGYSYSETSMAESYPWSDRELYVDNSPLYLADRIHTPLLFTHGTADTNVPISESIQLFTALKLLGAETAFVNVPGEDHRAATFSLEHRFQWHRTLFAWFAKYLKDDPAWWDELYPEKTL